MNNKNDKLFKSLNKSIYFLNKNIESLSNKLDKLLSHNDSNEQKEIKMKKELNDNINNTKEILKKIEPRNVILNDKKNESIPQLDENSTNVLNLSQHDRIKIREEMNKNIKDIKDMMNELLKSKTEIGISDVSLDENHKKDITDTDLETKNIYDILSIEPGKFDDSYQIPLGQPEKLISNLIKPRKKH